jgi:SAM-dependent methyltransferase
VGEGDDYGDAHQRQAEEFPTVNPERRVSWRHLPFAVRNPPAKWLPDCHAHFMSDSHAAAHRREADFHDAWAAGTRLEDVLVRESFEAPAAVENRFILRRMGPLAGKRLLDIGAGLGESSVWFALHGAAVTLVDVSPGMVSTALESGRRHGVQLEGIVSEGEDLKLPEAQFDLIYIANTIHHVQDRPRLFQQMRRALKPGGTFFSIDPVAYNPVINVYRRMATVVRTEDESPLSTADWKLARRYFSRVGVRHFWLTTLALFLKYYLVDRVHPNQDRYWKRILRETPRTLWWWLPLRGLDALLTRLPLVRWLSWNVVMWGTRES